jgi:TonB-dependent receptor
MKNNRFTKTQIATSLSIALGAFSAPMVYAADEADDVVEVIEIKGIRGSVIKSMDAKRSSTGIVDTISSEDMGKFPDTNLAESLQRISGVSIDRSNGEGQKVTVRGFSAQRNMVTLNGRQMVNTNGDRSFNFDNLSAEGISGLEVNKTTKASLPAGGIGATINLVTNQPLSLGVTKASFAAKILNDTSTVDGSVTPELSGIYSTVLADGKLGVSITANYAERESGSQQAEVGTGFRSFEAVQDQDWSGSNATWGGVPYDNQVNRPDPSSDSIYSVPQTTVYKFEEQQRKRLNTHLVLQYQLAENIRATVDAMYVKKEVDVQYNDVSAWFTFAPSENVWSDGPIASPLLYSETYPGDTQDLSMGARDAATVEESTMLGFNFDWKVNDDLGLKIDAHTSEASNLPNSKYGSSNSVSLMSRIREGAAVDFTGTIPHLKVLGAENLTPESMEVAGSWFRNDRSENSIDQFQLSGDYNLNDYGSIDFGVGTITAKNHRREAPQVQRDDWGGRGTGVFDASQLPVSSIYDNLDLDKGNFNFPEGPDVSGWTTVDTYYKWDFDTIIPIAEALYGLERTDTDCGTNFCPSNNYAAGLDRNVEETTTSLYFQYNYNGEIGDMYYDVHFGVRHEETEVTSTSSVQSKETYTIWQGDTELIYVDIADDFEYQTRTADYSNTLPSLNVNLELTDDMVLRFAYGKSINRADYSSLVAGANVGNQYNESGGSIDTGTPGLLPLESTNLDISFEYYYDEGSYASVALFDKSITNGITSNPLTIEVPQIRTPLGGERWTEAVTALGANNAGDVRQWIYDNYGDTDEVYLNSAGSIIIESVSTDPLIDYSNSTQPANSDETQGYTGAEFTVQHMFGETGYGVIGNYTVVSTDNQYDDSSLTIEGADPETNISDSANLVGFYDASGLQIRLAYNWRDEFLVSWWENADTNPKYTEEYSQLDLSVNYDLPQVEGLTVFLEGINITNEYTRSRGRSTYQVLNVTQTGARYAIGARYSF